jgi:molybdopterin-guanine dinucleotide biosynthesis protein A
MPARRPGEAVPPPRRPAATWAIVLVGGRSSRFGTDKTAARLGRSQVLETLLAGLAPDLPAVLVGPQRPVGAPGRTLRWARERPPGGGPVAGLAAGADALPDGTELALLLGGDQPFAGSAIPRLLAALDTEREADAAMAVAPDGSRQLLSVAVRVPALRAALPAHPAGRSVRSLALSWRIVEVPVSEREALDVDTPDDLRRAETFE